MKLLRIVIASSICLMFQLSDELLAATTENAGLNLNRLQFLRETWFTNEYFDNCLFLDQYELKHSGRGNEVKTNALVYGLYSAGIRRDSYYLAHLSNSHLGGVIYPAFPMITGASEEYYWQLARAQELLALAPRYKRNGGHTNNGREIFCLMELRFVELLRRYGMDSSFSEITWTDQDTFRVTCAGNTNYQGKCQFPQNSKIGVINIFTNQKPIYTIQYKYLNNETNRPNEFTITQYKYNQELMTNSFIILSKRATTNEYAYWTSGDFRQRTGALYSVQIASNGIRYDIDKQGVWTAFSIDIPPDEQIAKNRGNLMLLLISGAVCLATLTAVNKTTVRKNK